MVDVDEGGGAVGGDIVGGGYKLKLKLFTTCTVCAGFTPKAVCAGCCLWALPTMPYKELTSQG
jgi:hypothetical protein